MASCIILVQTILGEWSRYRGLPFGINDISATESSIYGDSDLRITLRIRSFKMDYAYPAFRYSNLLSRRIGQMARGSG